MITIIQSHLTSPKECDDFLFVLQAYAKDPMGGGKKLPNHILSTLIDKLKNVPNHVLFLAYDNDQIVGMANCFSAFSTFKALPLLNIHDFAILEKYRGKGIGKSLIEHVKDYCIQHSFCKITLEVLENNTPAKSLYAKMGFNAYELEPKMGKALFLEKLI